MAKKRGVPAHGRKSARFHRARKKRYLVVAGGAVTERQYFKQLESYMTLSSSINRRTKVLNISQILHAR